MRFLKTLAMLFICTGTVGAQSPPPDQSAALFAGEWSGIGEGGAHCYLNLQSNGRGWVLIDAGTGDLLGAQLRWRNQHQRLQIDEIIPVAASPGLRTMPLAKFNLLSGFNRSLRLDWQPPSGTCQMQRTTVSAYQLSQAREVVEKIQSGVSKP